MKKSILAFFLWAGLLPLVAFGQTTFLVEEGEPRAKIVIAEDPPRMVDLAARELQEYVKKISDAELPVGTSPSEELPNTIYIGQSSYTDELGITDEGLSWGAFRMVSGPDYLVLLGHDEDFEPIEPWAQRHGDRERAQEEWREISGFASRNPMGSLHRSLHRESGIWTRDEGGSLQAVYQFLRDLGVRWFMPGDLGEVVPEMASIPLPEVDETIIPDVRFRDLRLGNVSQFSWEDYIWHWRLGLNNEGVGGAHGMRGIMSNDEWRKNHPEFYVLYGGERQTHTQHACLSNADLRQKVIEYVRTVFDHFDVPAVNIMPEDGYRHCEDEPCADMTPSDVVWDFVNEVASAVYETHPDKLVICGAYSAYRDPPENIDQLPPNVAVRISWVRPGLDDPERFAEFEETVDIWKGKLAPHRLLINANVQWSSNPRYPLIFPRSIAKSLSALQGQQIGENSSIPRSRDDRWENIGVSHLNTYVLSRYFWDAGQDVEELLDDYYTSFYGPAAGQMREAFEFAEASYSRIGHPNRDNDLNDTIQLIALVEAARETAGDTVYGERIDVVLDGLMSVEEIHAQLAELEAAIERRKEGPMIVAADTTRDQEAESYHLVDLVTGEEPPVATTFEVFWEGDAMVFDILCEEPNIDEIPITANVWGGDSVAILLETPFHSYYHIEVNADGDLFDADWELGRVPGMDNWSAEAEVEAEKGEDYWRVRVRIPVVSVAGGQDDPLHFVVGPAPSVEDPWYFNVGRTRGGIREGVERERFLFSPTGGGNFHQPDKFGRLVVE